MGHEEAVATQAAVRYLAGELSPADRDAFEDHFFDCPDCAAEVRLGHVFAANMRAVARERKAVRQATSLPETFRVWLRRKPAVALSLAVNFVLAIGVGYILMTGAPPSVEPQLLPAYFAPAQSRGAEVHEIRAGSPAFLARIPEPEAKYGALSYEILNAAGSREAAHETPTLAAEGGNLYLQVPVKALPAGVHTLVVRGLPGGEIISWSRFRTTR